MRVEAAIVERPGPHRPGVWAGFVVPETVVEVIAPDALARKRIPVVVRLGDVAYRSSLTRQADGWEFIASVEFRAETGTAVGDVIAVDIALDTEERTIETPVDVREALEREGLLGWWVGLSYSHQREVMLYIDDAKRPETRVRRIEAMVDLGRKPLQK